MQVQLLTVGALALGKLAQRRNEGKKQRTEAAEDRKACNVAAAANQATANNQNAAASRGGSLHRVVLLLAAVVDATLWYCVYKALVSDKGWRSQPKSLWIAAALSAVISLLYLLHQIFGQGEGRGGTSRTVTWKPSTVPGGSARLAQNLTGTWIKDGQASDGMEEAVQLMQLNALTRTAVKLVKGIEIQQTADRFDLAVFSVITWFKVRESYPMNGDEREEKRRDMRRGKHRGRLLVDKDGCIRLKLKWDEPFGGTGHEIFRLVSPTELHALSQLNVRGKTVKYKSVYRKK